VLIATSTHNIAEIRLRWALITNQSINQLQEVGNKESDRKMFLSQLATMHFDWFRFDLWCLTPLSAIFQFYWWRTSEYPDKLL
jgi:hypothetical protein